LNLLGHFGEQNKTKEIMVLLLLSLTEARADTGRLKFPSTGRSWVLPVPPLLP